MRVPLCIIAGVLISAGDEIRVELLDESGYRVRGVTREGAVPLTGDSLRHAVRWKHNASPPPGKRHLRLHLLRATVYALSITPNPA